MKITQNNIHGDNFANVSGEKVELFQTKGSQENKPMNIETILKDFDEKFPIKHYSCADGWYSCPMSEDGCLDQRKEEKCDCYAEEEYKERKTFLLTSLLSVLKEQEKEILEDEDEENIVVPQGYNIGEYRFVESIKREGINQERQRQRTSLTNRIKEIEQLLK